ncbi:hypothetical protein PIB30_046532 [Stylosanthes scabra]|uniref:Uncharacterized protein n=1 Tax=Stylosanthes scabra TaxID=79078 RepID=A0ABU6RH57_9FABA|nr:hypothetical protein [Stylosanthes scabra]
MDICSEHHKVFVVQVWKLNPVMEKGCLEEVDLNRNLRSQDMDLVETSSRTVSPKVSYKDSLLAPKGPNTDNWDISSIIVDENEPNPEDPWYKDTDLPEGKEKTFDPYPTIPISNEEFEDWCKP